MRTLNGLSVFLLSSLLAATPGHASSFQHWKNQQYLEFNQTQYEFRQYQRELQAAFRQYKRKTGRIWGKENIVPDNRRWVSFINDLNHRSVVDFSNGSIEVEVAMPPGQNVSDEDARKQLEETMLAALGQGMDNRTIQEIAQQPVALPEGPAVLEGQIGDRTGDPVTRDEYSRIIGEAIADARKKRVRGDDGRTRTVYEGRLRLVPEHIRIRAQKYEPLVDKYAEEQGIPEPVVFAVMETESFFNPTARSSAPAFGLMQLVPTSGARDAYQYLYKQDRIVSESYLYNPDNNVRLGTAYLHRLYYDYMKGIEDDRSRLLCSIAAYNTGAGNVFRAFAGEYYRARYGSYDNYRQTALDKINSMTSDEVFDYMRRNLTHREARDYIKKVTDRIPKYGVVQI